MNCSGEWSNLEVLEVGVAFFFLFWGEFKILYFMYPKTYDQI